MSYVICGKKAQPADMPIYLVNKGEKGLIFLMSGCAKGGGRKKRKRKRGREKKGRKKRRL